MPRTSVAAQTPKGPYPGTVSAGDLDITMTAGDVANGNEVPFVSSQMLLVAQNTHASSAFTITLTSATDSHGRLGTITSYSLAAADVIAFVVARDGWEQSGGLLYVDVEDATVKFAALRL